MNDYGQAYEEQANEQPDYDAQIAKLESQVKELITTLKMVLVHLKYRSTGEQAAEFAGMIESLREVA